MGASVCKNRKNSRICFHDTNMHEFSLIQSTSVAKELKIIQYVDDSTLVLMDYDSPRRAFYTAELYGLANGTRLNIDKCKGL